MVRHSARWNSCGLAAKIICKSQLSNSGVSGAAWSAADHIEAILIYSPDRLPSQTFTPLLPALLFQRGYAIPNARHATVASSLPGTDEWPPLNPPLFPEQWSTARSSAGGYYPVVDFSRPV